MYTLASIQIASVQEATLKLCIGEMPCLNFGRDHITPDSFHVFPQSFHANSELIPHIRHKRPLPHPSQFVTALQSFHGIKPKLQQINCVKLHKAWLFWVHMSNSLNPRVKICVYTRLSRLLSMTHNRTFATGYLCVQKAPYLQCTRGDRGIANNSTEPRTA
jgi:hypothetical protein